MSFGEYKFFSWARKGISGNIAEKDTLGKSDGTQKERAIVPVNVTLNTNIAVPQKNFTLVGPGDIIGIQQDMIIRCEPRNGVSNFEPNYFPYIEFYDEDFPWRYTPASAAGTGNMSLRPWISLVVLKEDEFEDTPLQSPLKSIVVKNMNALQRADELHLWAHMHSNLKNDETNFEKYIESLANDIKTDPDGVYSRVMCPRKLEANAMYYAFLIPTFETGRLAALGQPITGIPAQKAAWHDGLNETEFPVYFRWNFRTGANFDFESLVKLIEPRVMDKRVGVRPMDCSKPGYFQLNSSEEIPAPNPAVILLEGAVKAPTAESTTIVPNEFQSSITQLVNLNRAQVEKTDGDPVVTIPFYGMYHAMRKDLSKPGEKIIPVFDPNSDVWYNDLNRDPRNRVPAGFGVKAVQDGQEAFMDKAWDQLSDVLEANKKSRLAQVMAAVMNTSFNKNIKNLSQEKVLTLTRRLASKILVSNFTIKKQISQSRIPEALFMAPTQKLMRVNSSISRTLEKTGTQQASITSIARDINKTGGITSASVDKFKSVAAVAGITTGVPSASIGKLNIWSTVSNLDETVKFQPVQLENGGFKNVLVSKALEATNVNRTGIIAPKAATPPVSASPATTRTNIPVKPTNIGDTPVTPVKPANVPVTSTHVGSVPAAGGTNVNVPATPTKVINTPATGAGIGQLPVSVVINDNYKIAYTENNIRAGYSETVPDKPLADIPTMSSKTLVAITPLNAYKSILNKKIFWGKGVVVPPVDDMLPAMAYPDFPDATYKLLIDRDKELLLPNLEFIQPNTFSLLRTNQKFIESYLVGLNYEMGRELLWREYPTDMRGSYFRQFWDVKGIISPTSSSEDAESLKDIAPIHTWDKTNELGENNARDKNKDSEQLVFVIRGDLLKKFPNTLIYAQKASRDENNKWCIHKDLDDAGLAAEVLFPQYQADVPPDIKLLGFDLTIDEAAGVKPQGDGWFFVIAEVPGEPRFGMDISFDPDKPDSVTWNDLSWENFDGGKIDFVSGTKPPEMPNGGAYTIEGQDSTGKKGIWGRSAADMATILLQRPVMIAVHATEMLDKEITNQNPGTAPTTKLITEYKNYVTNVLHRN
jgi:hypothetical protein